MNQKGFANIILVVVIIVFVGTVGYFVFVKEGKMANWETYANTQYGFSFRYPSNVFAYDAVDYTNGQIPDVAGFGYTKPGQYELGTVPAEKMGSARILVWDNVSQDLKSWAQIHEPNIKSWTDTKVGGIAALVNYSKTTTASEGSPMTFKTYYLKTGNEIIEISGFSVTNQYSDNWIKTFDKIVATFKFTGSSQWTKAQFPNDYHHSVNIMLPSTWVWDCCGDTGELSEHYIYPRSSANSLDTSPIIIIDDFVMSDCPDGKYNSCNMEELERVTPSQYMNSLTKHLDKNGDVFRFNSLKKMGSVKLSNFALNVPIYQGVVSGTNQSVELYLIQSAKGVVGILFQQPQNFDVSLKTEFLNRLTSN